MIDNTRADTIVRKFRDVARGAVFRTPDGVYLKTSHAGYNAVQLDGSDPGSMWAMNPDDLVTGVLQNAGFTGTWQ